jgi:hypothetical protein
MVEELIATHEAGTLHRGDGPPVPPPSARTLPGSRQAVALPGDIPGGGRVLLRLARHHRRCSAPT